MLLGKCSGNNSSVSFQAQNSQQKKSINGNSQLVSNNVLSLKPQNQKDKVTFSGNPLQSFGLENFEAIQNLSEQEQNATALKILKSSNKQLKSDFQDFILENTDSDIFKNPKAIINTMIDNLNTAEERKTFIVDLYMVDSSLKPHILSKLVDKLDSSENELLLHSLNLVQSIQPQHKKDIIEKVIQKTNNNPALAMMYKGLEKVLSDKKQIAEFKLEINKKYTGPTSELTSATWDDVFEQMFNPQNFTDAFNESSEEMSEELWHNIIGWTYDWIPGLRRRSSER